VRSSGLSYKNLNENLNKNHNKNHKLTMALLSRNAVPAHSVAPPTRNGIDNRYHAGLQIYLHSIVRSRSPQNSLKRSNALVCFQKWHYPQVHPSYSSYFSSTQHSPQQQFSSTRKLHAHLMVQAQVIRSRTMTLQPVLAFATNHHPKL
jgi:hypothetical protein